MQFQLHLKKHGAPDERIIDTFKQHDDKFPKHRNQQPYIRRFLLIIMFTRLRTNSTQIDTSWQCMLKQNYTSPRSDTFPITLQWLQQVPLLCQMLSYSVSVDLYQHQRSSHFVFYFLKLNLYQHVICLNFSICTCGYVILKLACLAVPAQQLPCCCYRTGSSAPC